MRRYITIIIFLTGMVGNTAMNAQVARYWVGNGADRNWSDPANWSVTSGGSGGASVPGSTDTSYFDQNGSSDCNIDVTSSVASLYVQATYPGIIEQTDKTFTSEVAVLNGGTFSGGTANMDFNTITLSGGNLQATKGTMAVKGDFVINSGNFIHNNGTVKFNGTTAQQLTGTSISMNNITINNIEGVTLTGPLSGDGVIILQNGILDTQTDTLDIGTDGMLVEMQIVPASYVKGFVRAERTIGSTSGNQSFGGIGITITEPTFPNNVTVVTRETGEATMVGGITRYFDVEPTINIALSATVVFTYFEDELYDLNETSLMLYKAPLAYNSSDPGWEQRTSAAFNPASNTFTDEGVTSFSRWTAAIPEALPLELLSFTAIAGPKDVVLKWIIANETATNFSLYKSNDGINYTELQTILATPNGQAATYTYTDPTSIGSSYYRLVQKDDHGVVQYLKTIYVQNLADFGFNAYSDTKGELVVKLYGASINDETSLSFMNTNGQIIYTEKMEPGTLEQSLSFAGPSTVYIVTVSNGTNYALKKIRVE